MLKVSRGTLKYGCLEFFLHLYMGHFFGHKMDIYVIVYELINFSHCTL